MLRRLFTECMLRPADVAPSQPGFEVVGAFNPGVVRVGDETVLIVRIVEQSEEKREGYEASPRFDPATGEIALDWLARDGLRFYDPRVYHIADTGHQRLRFFSYLKVLRSRDGKTIDDFTGLDLMPANEFEEYGIEDPRITRIDGTFYITYVAVSRHGVASALMSTTDFKQFTRLGIIFCPENKDVLLFPGRVNGRYVAMHRPVTSIRFRSPEMWLAHSPDLLHWGAHEKILGVEATFEQSRIGGGTPPIATPNGWLTLYHGSAKHPGDAGPGPYTAGALLLDRDAPARIVAQSPHAVMVPEMDFERQGFVDNVVFPTAMVERDDAFYVYYGAADACTGVTAFERDALMAALQWVE